MLVSLERELIEFLILGKIPGTSYEISFDLFLVILCSVSMLVVTYRLIHHLHSTLKAKYRKNPELIAI